MHVSNPKVRKKLRCANQELLLLFGFSAAAGSADVVESDRTGTETNQRKSKGGESQRQFGAAIADQSVMEMHFPDGDGEVDAHGESGASSEQAQQKKQAADEFGEA